MPRGVRQELWMSLEGVWLYTCLVPSLCLALDFSCQEEEMREEEQKQKGKERKGNDGNRRGTRSV